jgi:hypothetical protein
MVDVYKADARENHRCYTCERPFEDDAAVAAFIAKQVPRGKPCVDHRDVVAAGVTKTIASQWRQSTLGHCLLQDQEIAELPARIQQLRGVQDSVRQQLAALRKLEPLHLRLQTLSHELLPAAQQAAEVPSSTIATLQKP